MKRNPAWIVVFLLVLAPVAGAQTTPSPGNPPGDGWGAASNWGPIPAESDSVRVQFENRTTPGWQKAVYLPFRIILLPLWVVDRVGAFTAGVVYESPAIRAAAAYAGNIPGPWGSYFRPTITAGGLPGLGGGVKIEHPAFFGPRNGLRLNVGLTINGDTRITSGAVFRGEHDTELEVGAGLRIRPNAQFYGIGPTAMESNESFYKQQFGWVGGEFRRRLAGPLHLEAEANLTTSYADTTTLDKIEADERTQNVFPVELLPGWGERSTGLGFGVALYVDTAPDLGRPGGGGIYRLQGNYFTDVDNTNISFWTFRGDFQQFIPLWNSKQTLAVRAYGSWIESTGGDPVPFQRLMTNDDPDDLRGYKDFRWRDRGLLAASFEYRWPIWVVSKIEGAGLDFYLLSDVGQVFGDATEIAWDNLTLSYGLGLRAVSTRHFMGRFEVAWSNEETVVRLVGSQNFQFSMGSLFRGNAPIPAR
jgi:outer membrane protein assembly factor BamA